MTPDAILAAFDARGPLPRAALQAAGHSRAAMVPVFLDYIDALQSAGADDAERPDAFVIIFFLLAEWRETRAYRPLATLLRRDPAFLDALLGDAITESAARVMAGVFDGDPQPLFDIILDPRADGFVRSAMFETLVMVARGDAVLAPRVVAFIADFHDQTGADTGEEVWWAWAEAVAALGLSDLAPQVASVFDRDLISPMLSSHQLFTQFLQATLQDGRPGWFETGPYHQPITDTIAELAPWHCFSAAYLAERARSARDEAEFGFWDREVSATVVLPPKVGRNDPCPCGSGRKYKKCCLA